MVKYNVNIKFSLVSTKKIKKNNSGLIYIDTYYVIIFYRYSILFFKKKVI